MYIYEASKAHRCGFIIVIIAWIKARHLLYKLHLILNSREDERTMFYTTQ